MRLLGETGLVLFLGLLAGCNRTDSSHVDLGTDLAVIYGCAAGCPTGQACVDDGCVASHGSCHTDADCLGDTYCFCESPGASPGSCATGDCIPWGVPRNHFVDDSCHGDQGTFDIKDFSIVERCHWDAKGYTFNVTPLVGDLDGDGTSEVITVASKEGEFSSILDGLLVAIASDCSLRWQVPILTPLTPPAIADLDRDGVPEIVLVEGMVPALTVFDAKGQVLARSDALRNSDAVAIADLDGVAPPEIVAGGGVFRFDRAQGTVDRVLTLPRWKADFQRFGIPAIADLDGDGIAEIIDDRHVFDGASGQEKTPDVMSQSLEPLGFSGVADFNGDGAPEIVLVSPTMIGVVDVAHDELLMGPFTNANPSPFTHFSEAGAPAIADFDGDGAPDFAVATPLDLCLYTMRCSHDPNAPGCAEKSGTAWCKETQDYTSGFTGATGFDFNGDGAREVVYRDECFLRVYDGRTGDTLAAVPLSSGTVLENPVVADLEGDGASEIVIGSDYGGDEFLLLQTGACPLRDADTKALWTGATRGLFIFEDPKKRWSATRGLWTSHSYHVTEIDDDLSVPEHEVASWTTENSYRSNHQKGTGNVVWGIPDLTAGAATMIDLTNQPCTGSFMLAANLCDRGLGQVPTGAAGAFYDHDPRVTSGKPLCVAHTQSPLFPGECQTVSCNWSSPPMSPSDVWFRANDDGATSPVLTECKTGNDLLLIEMLRCRPVG